MLRQTADVKFTENSGTLTAHIVGEIDHRGATGVRQIIDDAIKGGSTKSLELDLSGVNFMDSSGLGLVLGRYNNAIKLGVAFSVKNPSPSADRILSAVGAGRIIKIIRQDN